MLFYLVNDVGVVRGCFIVHAPATPCNNKNFSYIQYMDHFEFQNFTYELKLTPVNLFDLLSILILTRCSVVKLWLCFRAFTCSIISSRVGLRLFGS